MSREKQIEEMAKDLGIAFQLAGTTRFGAVAEVLVNAGYRKSTDLAEEIFAEIEKEIDLELSIIRKIIHAKGGRANGKTVLLGKIQMLIDLKNFIAELKKKYIGEDTNVTTNTEDGK